MHLHADWILQALSCIFQNFPRLVLSQKARSSWKQKGIMSHIVATNDVAYSGPKVMKNISCSTQLSMKFFLLINVKMPTIVGILTFKNKKNSIIGLSEPENAEFLDILYTYAHLKFHAQLS